MICDISTFMHVPGSCYLFDFIDMPNVFMFILRGAEQGWHIHDEGFRTSAGAFGGVICKVYRGWSFPPKKNTHPKHTDFTEWNKPRLPFFPLRRSFVNFNSTTTLPQHPSTLPTSINFASTSIPNNSFHSILPEFLPQQPRCNYRSDKFLSFIHSPTPSSTPFPSLSALGTSSTPKFFTCQPKKWVPKFIHPLGFQNVSKSGSFLLKFAFIWSN